MPRYPALPESEAVSVWQRRPSAFEAPPEQPTHRPSSHPSDKQPVSNTGPRELGRGRSGVVYLDRTSDGRLLARKVFSSSSLTKVVQCVFLGSPNPYV